ncbi:MAG TPA: DUF2723 domain-containing protein, partial [Candidatus Kapabacteria bacterium]|nr:DUF2723 domain-containing protein [Candidatus Kapabacteria bacterium]
MNTQKTNRIVAGGVFLVSFIQFAITVQPSVPFWDCGEFAAAANTLQVPHPPGAPLFVLVGRIFQMLPFGDPAWRINMVSVLASALTVMLLYLVLVNVIRIWHDTVETKTDKLLVFGASVIGALSLSFSDTFWFNGVESEVYASALLCTALTLWLITQWYHRADEAGNERYLLLIAYIIGLSMGIHPLGLLSVFTIVMIVCFRTYEITVKSFLAMCSAALLAFFIIYSGVMMRLPALLEGKLLIIAGVLILAMIFFIWRAAKRQKNLLLGVISVSILCLIAGYATYAVVLVRSNAHPPMNENQPGELSSLDSYISRQGYGDMTIWPRLISPNQTNVQTGESYTSDLEFLWKYQTEHMFLRYLYWQYIGRAGDVQDAPSGFTMVVIPDTKKDLKQWWYGSSYDNIFPVRFFGIPFLLGLFGLYWHFKKDWKTGLAFLVGFLAMGIGADLFQNQQLPQPRESDYFYTGAFFVYSLWIGIGAFGILELIGDKITDRAGLRFASVAGTCAVLAIAVDVTMGLNGWDAHNRSGNYVPWDYAYNTLQSCGKNAILFTAGDNDTFPLWYLQDVEGIRRDIRVVNLPLTNTHWYVSQLKNEQPYGTDVVPMSIPQSALDKPEGDPNGLYPQPGEPQVVTLVVPRDTMAHYTNDPALLLHPVIRFTYAPDMTFTIKGRPVQYISEPEQVVFDIIKTNAEQGWKRPICWANTCSPDEYIGLGDYVRSSGIAVTLVPVASRSRNGMDAVDLRAIEQNLLHEPGHAYGEQHYGFRFRDLNDPHLYLDEVHRQLLTTYRQAFLTLAMHCAYDEKPDVARADSVLNIMNAKIPHEIFPMQ